MLRLVDANYIEKSQLITNWVLINFNHRFGFGFELSAIRHFCEHLKPVLGTKELWLVYATFNDGLCRIIFGLAKQHAGSIFY